jgi:predicted short-subunit dehydrogenase-like oxidoreductase (DUF2520 family)
LRGCVWALETNDDAFRGALREMVVALGGQSALLTESDRVPYHISGVLASNYVVTLIGAAVALWESFGVDALLARELSGPIARGDIGTLHAHLDWLSSAARDREEVNVLRDAYLALARLTVPLAEAKGTLTSERAAAIRALLDDAQDDARKAE